jgi:hypothetical protein
MTKDPAFERTLSAATLSLLACGGCIAAFVPPFNERVLQSVPLLIALGLGIAVSFVLHLIYVGIGARQLGRRPLVWVLLALLSFPIASIVVLALLHWQAAGEKPAPGQPTA